MLLFHTPKGEYNTLEKSAGGFIKIFLREVIKMAFQIPNCAICAEITLDLDAVPGFKTVHCKQNDAGSRYIKVIPQKNGVNWLPGAAAALLRVTKPDDTSVVTDCTVESGGTYALLPANALSDPGVARADILYYDGTSQIGTATFFIVIEESSAPVGSVVSPESAEPIYKVLGLIKELESAVHSRVLTVWQDDNDPFWQTFYAEDSTNFSFYKYPPVFDGEKFRFADDTCESGSAEDAYEDGYLYFITGGDEDETFCKLKKEDGVYGYDRYAHLFAEASEWLEIEEAAAERASLKAGEAATSAFNALDNYNKTKALYDALAAAFPERFA